MSRRLRHVPPLLALAGEVAGEAPAEAERPQDARTYVGVALDLPMQHLFTYRVPAEHVLRAAPGHRVEVPFRGRRLVGFVVERQEAPRLARIMDIAAAPDEEAVLTPQLLELGRFIARYYGASLGEALAAMVPRAVRQAGRARTQVRVALGPAAPTTLEGEAGLRPPQQRVLRVLRAAPGGLLLAELCAKAQVSRSPIQTMEKADILATSREDIPSDPLVAAAVLPADEAPPPQPTTDQARAIGRLEAALDTRAFASFVLFGVTGSGKTEVYLRALARCIALGRQAIVLVPEIALTPQTVRRFRNRFDRVEVLHSAMSEADRGRAWRRLRAGEADVVVGPRSAIFAPVPRLGLVVVDEEHESSFKQQNAPRYHARDIALVRARAAGAVAVLGSATPSLETWQNASDGRHERLDLPTRVAGRRLPEVRIVDLRDRDERPRGRGHIGRTLGIHIAATLEDKGQVMLLQNRRGFATSVSCPRCGNVVSCPYCSVHLTYHRSGQTALCHLCGHARRVPRACEDCGLPALEFHGVGTQTIEDELASRFPQARVARMDSDSMVLRGAHEAILDRFGRGEIDVLLGTQMIAKGLDFPNVLLVGIVSADTSLALPDFRSAERTFQLLAQVAGRAGRGERGGRVIVQTRRPEHPAIRLAALQDHAAFAAPEIEDRRLFGYPPHRRLLRVLLRGPSEPALEEHAARLRDELVAAALPTTQILGPATPPIAKIQERHRRHLLVKALDHREIGRLLDVLAAHRRPPRGVDVAWDVDPQSIL